MLFVPKKGERILSTTQSLTPEIHWTKPVDGGHLIPEMTQVAVKEYGLRGLLIRLRLIKPRYEWLEVRRIFEAQLAKCVRLKVGAPIPRHDRR